MFELSSLLGFDMGSTGIIFMMIGFCVVVILGMTFSKQLRHLLRFGVNGLAGMLFIYLLNMGTALVGLTIGINLLTVLFVGLLGLPGLASVYIMQFLL